ncbi:hypothetical protein Bca52824_086452 [Brassica carinata]|uniref:Uncharacterized protein n=1 Tax=Brassica carinata TaxID=52824 RepID=A0A8X7TM91_BRACI|nr:hypothetical protein Bca52824_086452 [Brassica carinata]
MIKSSLRLFSLRLWFFSRTLKRSQTGGHHCKEDYAVRGKEPKDRVQIYTWKDANLCELTYLYY